MEIQLNDPDNFIDETIASGILGLSKRTLQKFRVVGGGPNYVKLGAKTVRYQRRALLAWAASRQCRSTSEKLGGGDHAPKRPVR